jgi:hypothetical protein
MRAGGSRDAAGPPFVSSPAPAALKRKRPARAGRTRLATGVLGGRRAGRGGRTRPMRARRSWRGAGKKTPRAASHPRRPGPTQEVGAAGIGTGRRVRERKMAPAHSPSVPGLRTRQRREVSSRGRRPLKRKAAAGDEAAAAGVSKHAGRKRAREPVRAQSPPSVSSAGGRVLQSKNLAGSGATTAASGMVTRKTAAGLPPAAAGVQHPSCDASQVNQGYQAPPCIVPGARGPGAKTPRPRGAAPSGRRRARRPPFPPSPDGGARWVADERPQRPFPLRQRALA